MSDTIATLADADRRTVLSCLDDHCTAVDIESLAADVVAARDGTPRDDVTEEAREKALVRLHHVDLPKLDEAGFVAFDHEAGTVTRRRDDSVVAASVLSD
jgi:hypothetical protein